MHSPENRHVALADRHPVGRRFFNARNEITFAGGPKPVFFKVNGSDVFASDGGVEHQSGQRALVLIHGSGANHAAWDLQNKYFAERGINVFSVDLPGHGRSAGLPLTEVAELSSWLDLFFTAAGLQRATVLGHSLGALVGIHFAATRANRCERVILAGVNISMAVNPRLLDAARENDSAALEMLDSWCHSPASIVGGVAAGGAARRLLEAAARDVLFADLSACDRYTDMQHNLARISVPMMVIAGADDKMTPPKAAEKLLKRSPGADYVVISDAGHNMMMEQPGDFNRAVRVAMGD